MQYLRKPVDGYRQILATSSRGGKILFVLFTMILACCFCSLPLMLISPDPEDTEPTSEVAAAIDEVSRSEDLEIDLSEPTAEPESTSTPAPTATEEPTETPAPTNTAIPTATTEPTDTLAPTSTTAPTLEPPTATIAPTQPPPEPTAPPVPTAEPTQPPLPTDAPAPTAPPAPTEPAAVVPGQVVIVGVDKRAEFVDIMNQGGEAVSIDGWMLRSEKGSQDCGLSGVLAPGQVLRIWAMAEDAGQGGFNCNFDGNIWNNSEYDPAVLFDNNKNEVSRW